MSILQTIEDARKQALRDKDTAKRTTLTTLVGEITSKAKIEGREPTDKDTIKALTKFINSATEMSAVHAKNNDVVDYEAAQAEIALYQSFLPAAKEQLSAEALQRVVRSVIASRLAGDGVKPKMGTVIADIKLLHDGEYDPKALSVLVKTELDATADPSKV